MAAVTAVNLFSLLPGVPAGDFEEFSRTLDRPTCLAHDVVHAFETYLVQAEAAVDVVEVMTVSSWAEWEEVRDHDPAMAPVVARFEELVDAGSVVTYLTRRSTDSEEA